jgi:hypothetical protein
MVATSAQGPQCLVPFGISSCLPASIPLPYPGEPSPCVIHVLRFPDADMHRTAYGCTQPSRLSPNRIPIHYFRREARVAPCRFGPTPVKEKAPVCQAVWKREAPAIRGLFFVGSGETGPKTRCANQIDCSQDVVGEYPEGGFGFDLIETSGEEAPACCHSRDNDRAYGQAFTRRLRAMGIRDRPISPRSPWQNA